MYMYIVHVRLSVCIVYMYVQCTCIVYTLLGACISILYYIYLCVHVDTTVQEVQSSVKLSCPKSPSGHSQLSITTTDIDNLTLRNEERARRLESILNANSSTRVNQQDPQMILQNFLDRRNSREQTRSNRAAGVLASRASEISLEADTIFTPLPSSK